MDLFEHYRGRLTERYLQLSADLSRFDDRQAKDAEVQDYGDRAATDYNKEEQLVLLARDRDLLSSVREALQRGAKGTFGICQNCGAAIERSRLDAVPWTRYCIACQKLADEGRL